MQYLQAIKNWWQVQPPAVRLLVGFFMFVWPITLFAAVINIPVLSLLTFPVSLMLMTIMMYHQRLWVLTLYAWVTRRQVVELLDYNGKLSYTLVYKHTLDQAQWKAPVYWLTEVGEVWLQPDGTIDASSPSSYMDAWRPMDKELRLKQVLAYGIPSGFKDNY